MLPDSISDKILNSVDPTQIMKYRSDADKILQRLQYVKTIQQRIAKQHIIDTDNSGDQNKDVETNKQIQPIDKQPNDYLTLILSQISTKKCNNAIQTFAHENYAKAKEIFELMKILKLEVSEYSYQLLMKSATRNQMIQESDKIFDELLSSNVTPSIDTWTRKINNLCCANKPDDALALVDQLLKNGLQPSTQMFIPIMRAYIANKRYDDVENLWNRMHLEKGLTLDKYAFSLMIRYCARIGNCERAFFFYDELKSLKIQPDEIIFVNLFDACATAPHWVNGYHDVIFDAMSAMEGYEIIPTVKIYNSIIYGFGSAGDPIAAEYYFWEMKRKGLIPDIWTYYNLLDSYVRAQTVGASTYGTKGRYIRKIKTLTQDEKDYQTLGPQRVSEISKNNNIQFVYSLITIVSSGISSDYNPIPGKRVKPVLYDLVDESPDGIDEEYYVYYIYVYFCIP